MTTLLTRKAVRFFLIVGGGALVALLLWAAQNLFNIPLPGADTSPLEVRLIAAPAVYDWVSQAANRFNTEGQRLNRRPVTVRVTSMDGLSVYNQINSSSLRPAPSAWIAEGEFAFDLANLAARQSVGKDAFSVEGSVAQSVLMWGGFADRVAALDSRSGGLNWPALHDAAAASGWASLGGQSSWGFFKLVLPDPRKSSEGLAALLSAAAEFHQKTDLTASDINDARFQEWAQPLVDSVPNFANLGNQPGQALAVRGPSAGDAGLLLESDWVKAADGLSSRQAFVFRYAASAVMFDFPFAIWVGPEQVGQNAGSDSSRRDAEQQAARLFYQYLLADAQQRSAETFGLRSASGGAGESFSRWSALGIQSAVPATSKVSAEADAVLAALHWVERAVR
jgi:hypothetical protein